MMSVNFPLAAIRILAPVFSSALALMPLVVAQAGENAALSAGLNAGPLCREKTGRVEYCLDSEGDSMIVRPSACGEEIGEGGNYRSIGNRDLLGKCSGSGESVRLESETGGRYLAFSTASGIKTPKDRAELASPKYYDFNKDLYISLDLRIPAGSPVTDDFLYLLQLWQCPGLPPIVGLRINRGTSNELGLVARSESAGSTPNKSIARILIEESKWNKIILQVRPSLEDNGLITLYHNGVFVGEWAMNIGFSPKKFCRNDTEATRYRVKFGIYKGNEPSHRFVYHFDNIIVTTNREGLGI